MFAPLATPGSRSLDSVWGVVAVWGKGEGVGYHGYLSQAGVDGAHQHPEGLAGAAPHGAEDLAQEGNEAQPALHVRLLQLVPVGEVPLWAAGQTDRRN